MPPRPIWPRPARRGEHTVATTGRVVETEGLRDVAVPQTRQSSRGRRAGRLRRMLRSRMPAPAQQLRLALEQLGTTFVKLGQILATRADLLPAEYQIELGRLQDDDRPEIVDAIRGVIATELGHPVEDLYASFDPSPLAAASIGQAHAAVTLDGVD